MPQQPATLDDLIRRQGLSAPTLDNIIDKYISKPAPQMLSGYGSARIGTPNVLTRIGEGISGLFNFGKTALGAQFGDVNSQLDLGQGMVDLGQQSYGDFKKGDYAGGIARIAGYPVESIREDMNAGRPLSAFVSALIPTGANMALGAAMKGPKAPKVPLETELRNIIPARELKALPEPGRTYERPGFMARDNGTIIDVNSPFNQEIADSISGARAPGSTIPFFDRPNRPVIRGALPPRGGTTVNSPRSFIGKNGELIVENPRNSPYFRADEITNPTADEMGLLGKSPIEQQINETHPGPGIGRGAEDLGLQARAGSFVELPKRPQAALWEDLIQKHIPQEEAPFTELPKKPEVPSWNWKSKTTDPTASDLMLDKIKQFISETKGEADPKIYDKVRKALLQGLATNSKLSQEGIDHVQGYINDYSKLGGKELGTNELQGLLDKYKQQIPTYRPDPRIEKIVPTDSEIKITTSAIDKLVSALQQAKPLREIQEQLYTEERSKRVGEMMSVKERGQEGFYKQAAALKGEMPKVDFDQFKLDDIEVNSLLNAVTDNKYVTPFEKFRAKSSIMKMLAGDGVPTRGDIGLLHEIFGSKLGTSLEQLHGGIGGPVSKEILIKAANAPKAFVSSIDLSAPLNQGLPLITEKTWWTSLYPMVKAFGSKAVYEGHLQAIRDRPLYLLGREAGLSITDITKDLAHREEAFASFDWMNKGKYNPLAASERAYTLYLDKIRADTFDKLMNQYSDASGIDLSTRSPELLDTARKTARTVNTLSGRGDLATFGEGINKSFKKNAAELNTAFFSPKLIASRLTILNPKFYIEAEPLLRKQALKSLFGMAGASITLTQLARMLTGGTTETDPTSADFMKSKTGNVRFETFGGFQQYAVAGAREIKAAQDLIQNIRAGKKAGPYDRTPLSVIGTFLRQKESPLASFIHDMATGSDMTGKPVSMGPEILRLFTPMLLNDMYELYQEDPSLLPLGLPAALGGRLQSYKPNQAKPSMQLRIPR